VALKEKGYKVWHWNFTKP